MKMVAIKIGEKNNLKNSINKAKTYNAKKAFLIKVPSLKERYLLFSYPENLKEQKTFDFILHKKGKTLFTINGLNKFIDQMIQANSVMKEQVSKVPYFTNDQFKIDWESLENKLIISSKKGELGIYNTILLKIFNFDKNDDLSETKNN